MSRHRKIRRGPGDYLLVSDDRRTLWHIYRHEEDGTLVRGSWPNEEPITGTYWSADRLHRDSTMEGPLVERNDDGTISKVAHPSVDAWMWAEWDSVVSLCSTMREALEGLT